MLNMMPNELILQILKSADAPTAREVSFVCKRFRNVFETFRPLMQKDVKLDVVINFGETGIDFQWKRGNRSGPLRSFDNLSFDGLKEVFNEANKYYHIKRIQIGGLFCDFALEMLATSLKHQCSMALAFVDCQLAFTDMGLWRRFLSIICPSDLVLHKCVVWSSYPIFPSDIVENYLANVAGISLSKDIEFVRPTAAAEIDSLLQLKAYQVILDRKFTCRADTIIEKVERWVRGEEALQIMNVSYFTDEHDRLMEFVKGLPGGTLSSERVIRKRIVNNNGRALGVWVALAPHNVFGIHLV